MGGLVKIAELRKPPQTSGTNRQTKRGRDYQDYLYGRLDLKVLNEREAVYETDNSLAMISLAKNALYRQKGIRRILLRKKRALRRIKDEMSRK